MIPKKSHSLCNMTLYSYFPVVNVSTSKGFQRPTSRKVLHHKQHQRHMTQVLSLQWLKRSTFISKFSFATFSLSVDRPCHLEPFISIVNEAKQQGEITERVSTMPLYEMVVELLAGIGARYISFKFTICMLITPLTETLNTPTISSVMDCSLTQRKWLLMVLASAITT